MHRSVQAAASFVLTRWSRIGLAAVSIGIAWFAWTRPISPDWTQPFGQYGSVTGISKFNQLVTLEQSQLGGPAKLQIRDMSTGNILRVFHLAEARYARGQVTPDGEWAVVQADSKVQMMVISLESGQLRYSPRYCERVLRISPDSRYATIHLGDYKLIDLATGLRKAGFFPGEVIFSADSQRLLASTALNQVSILNLSDMTERSLGEIPAHPIHMTRPKSATVHWLNDRLYVPYSVDPGDKRARGLEYWSFDTRGETLSDPRPEPNLKGRSHGLSYFNPQWRDGHPGMVRVRESWKAGSIYEKFAQLLLKIKIRVGNARILYSWQPLEPRTFQPQGAMVENLDSSFRISPDGQWLVDGSDQLRCWHLPARRGLFRLVQTLLAGLIPWGILFLRRRRAAISAAGQHGQVPLSPRATAREVEKAAP
jgi:hypothetical protein